MGAVRARTLHAAAVASWGYCMDPLDDPVPGAGLSFSRVFMSLVSAEGVAMDYCSKD